MAERFIRDADYDDLIREEVRNNLDKTPDGRLLRQAESKAIAQMKMRLSGRYDTDKIFRVPGDDEPDTRDAFIVMTVIDITLYHLWSKERSAKVPETRNDRYQDAIDWLKAVGSGEDIADLPARLAEEVTGGIQIYSLHAPNNNKY